MGVYVYSGVGFGFVFSGEQEEVEEELLAFDPEKSFEVMDMGEGDLMVGLVYANHMSGEGAHFSEFEIPDKETQDKLEKVKELMEVYSDTKFHYYFYYA